MNYKTALKYTRYNSGTHFLDSGGAYGRHWQTPPPPPEPLRIPTDGQGYAHDVSLNVTHMLAEYFQAEPIHYAHMQQIPGHSTRDLESLDWFEHTRAYLESRGYAQLARDNVYNAENDFDQVWIYEIWQRPGHEVHDWVYADNDEVLCVLYIHTGCDVRGGYSRPLYGTFDLEYAIPLDWCVQWYISAAEDATDAQAAQADEWNESGEFMCGYSQNPTYHMCEVIGTDSGTWTGGVFRFEGLPYMAHPSVPYWY